MREAHQMMIRSESDILSSLYAYTIYTFPNAYTHRQTQMLKLLC